MSKRLRRVGIDWGSESHEVCRLDGQEEPKQRSFPRAVFGRVTCMAYMMRRAITTGALLLLISSATASHAAPKTYVVDPGASVVTIHVGKAGLFKFAGHEHEVMAQSFSGQVMVEPEQPGDSKVTLTFDAAALRVSAKGEPPEDVLKVQEKMAGADVLSIVRFPKIGFESKRVAGRKTGPEVWELEVTGDFSLHGFTRPFTLKVRVEFLGPTLTATGRTTLKQTDFGLSPVSVAGVVKVKDDLAIDFRIVARASP